jgi:glucose/arabinose dehydrogenase
MRFVLTLVAALLPSLAFAQTADLDGVRLEFVPVLEGLERPVVLTTAPGDGRLVLVEKTGRILVFAEGETRGTTMLDMRSDVSKGGEQGLLGLAFHPAYAQNGRFFVNYTDKRGDTKVLEFSARDGVADPASARLILAIDQPFPNHNGGWIGFGPDGFLYIGMGDGGSRGDPNGNGQNKDVLLGKILRIDVDSAEPYGIPSSNPFAQGGGAPEVFLLGLRNPWRNAFDGNDLYIADVGQGSREEIDVVSLADAGANLGWNTMEGRECYPPGSVCVQGGFVMPVHDYGHDLGCSVTGGFVYRGTALPSLAGRYFFADYCSGAVESFRYANGEVTGHVSFADSLGSLGNITSFGNDAAGELYVLTDDGRALKMVAAAD